MSITLGFGVEMEAELRFKANWVSSYREYYQEIVRTMQRKGMPAATYTGDGTYNSKYPENYNKWWITNDRSIKVSEGNFSVEFVSPIRNFESSNWESEIQKFWTTMSSVCEVNRNMTCGTHIHVAPWGRKFTLRQTQTIAFACCYYEPYVVSLMPEWRRDNKYCQRNTKVSGQMGKLFNEGKLQQIANDIKGTITMKDLCTYVQGGAGDDNRRVMWNFKPLLGHTGTIEFRGGRQMLGPMRTLRWTAFVVVFITLALEENLLRRGSSYRLVNNDKAVEVQGFWERIKKYASRLGLGSHLPPNFKHMSEKEKKGNLNGGQVAQRLPNRA